MSSRRGRLVWLLVAVLGLVGGPASAFETDQFTLPPQPLGDVGPEIDAHLHAIIDDAITTTNQQIAALESKRDAAESDAVRASAQREIDALLDPMTIARAIKACYGEHLPVSSYETWALTHAFKVKPAYYKPDFRDTVLADQALWKPLLIGAMSPTFNVHGVLQGADKLGHLYQQGFDYYTIYRDALAAGKSESEAITKAVDWGVLMEKTWGGQWWTGVYSNADLAANFAGLRFYTNLAAEAKVGDRVMPPILLTAGSRWAWNPQLSEDWFAVYVSEHFDEAMNPPRYDGIMRSGIRKRIFERGAAWVEFHHTNRAAEEARLQRLQTWHGEPYGHCGWKDAVTIISAYFGKIDPPKKADK
ncbi:MAG: hypothetical protein GC159_12190 [Phycisphaera sp.]|nr:hypothetical protein [Phycisphaera sp.]